MNYTKPEVVVLGEAVSVIEVVRSIKPGTAFDGQLCNPDYDLDE